MPTAALFLLLQIAIPAPRGYVNDFAGVLDAASVAHMEAVIADLRAKTRGEIAVVTLADIGDRAASDVAVQVGRQWGVGAKGEAGDPAKNLGVVVLLVPQKNHRPGTGHIFIATGRGAEGFLPDARAGRIRDAMVPYLAREDYGTGLAVGVDLVAQAFVDEFGVTLETGPVTSSDEPSVQWQPGFAIALWILVALFVILSIRRRLRVGPAIFWRGGGWRGGRSGWGGGGGGFSGGFGGFGGGGGFSGGGAGGRF
ncbi:MAG: TPM domain-containing protein [Gemmatimonadales bacterium]